MNGDKRRELDREVIESINYFEVQLFNTVRSGSKEQAEELEKTSMPLLINMVPKSLDRQDYILIPLLTIVSRAAMRGGADAIEVFQYYEYSLEEFQKVSTTEQFCHLFFTVVQKNTELVRSQKQTEPQPVLCAKCEKYIRRHMDQPVKIADLARECQVSERQIQRIFKQYYHMTVTEYIQKEKLERAAALLYATADSVSDISRELGYISQSYFTKRFKEAYGCTPAQFGRRTEN